MIDLTNMSASVAFAIFMAFLAGGIEFVKNLLDGIFGDPAERVKKLRTACIIAVAAAMGAFTLPAFSSFFTNITIEQLRLIGAVAGFSTSGAVTIAFNWGKSAVKDVPAPVEEPISSEKEILG